MLRKRITSSVGLLLGVLILLSESGILGGVYFDALKSKQKIEEDRIEIEEGESKLDFSFNFDDGDSGHIDAVHSLFFGSGFFRSYNSSFFGKSYAKISLYILFCSLKVHFC